MVVRRRYYPTFNMFFLLWLVLQEIVSCIQSLRINHKSPVVWGVAVCVRVGMCFCKVAVSGQDFSVTIKLSRWNGPNKWAGIVMSR